MVLKQTIIIVEVLIVEVLIVEVLIVEVLIVEVGAGVSIVYDGFIKELYRKNINYQDEKLHKW